MMNVLVTGGAGFFGRGFARAALRAGAARVCIYSRSEYQQHLMREECGHEPRLRFFIGDVRDADRLRRAMDGCDLVVHAAALKRVEVGEYDSVEMARTNVFGAMNVIKAAHEASVQRVVALSTDKAYHPVNAYGATKLVAEKLFLAANNDRGANGPIFSVTRYGNVAGSTGSVIPTWRAAHARGETVQLRDPEATRFWMHLDDAVQMVTTTALTMRGGELVIPQLRAYRLGDLAEAMGVRYRITGLNHGEKLHESMCEGRSSEDAPRMSVEELRKELQRV